MKSKKISSLEIKNWVFVGLLVCLIHSNCSANDSKTTDERKTLIITGASGELGGATAKLLACDYNLILTGRDLIKLNHLKDNLDGNNSGDYKTYPLDFISKHSIECFEHDLSKLNTSIAGLVIIVPRPLFHGKNFIQAEEIWLEVFQNTFTGPIEALKAILPYLSNPSKIVVISGTTSVQLQPEYGPSCVIRRMWTTYTKALAHQLGPQGITINALSPGVVLTNYHRDRIQMKSEANGITFDEQLESEVANIPLHRHAQPNEVAKAIKFLLSDDSDFINGVNLILDGGYTLSY